MSPASAAQSVGHYSGKVSFYDRLSRAISQYLVLSICLLLSPGAGRIIPRMVLGGAVVPRKRWTVFVGEALSASVLGRPVYY